MPYEYTAAEIARFWPRVQRVSECWDWMAGKTLAGYGRIRAGGRSVYAHRMSYELAKGPIPDGLTIDHLCRNRGCVNPAHLEAVPIGVNVLRGNGIAARRARGEIVDVKSLRKSQPTPKTHCIRGHELSGRNLVTTRSASYLDGVRRRCRICQSAEKGEQYRRRRAAAVQEDRKAL